MDAEKYLLAAIVDTYGSNGHIDTKTAKVVLTYLSGYEAMKTREILKLDNPLEAYAREPFIKLHKKRMINLVNWVFGERGKL